MTEDVLISIQAKSNVTTVHFAHAMQAWIFPLDTVYTLHVYQLLGITPNTQHHYNNKFWIKSKSFQFKQKQFPPTLTQSKKKLH